MKKVNEIKDVGYTRYLFGDLVYNKDIDNNWVGLYKINNNKEVEIFKHNVYKLYSLEDVAIIQKNTSSDCIIINENYEIIEEINGMLSLKKSLKNYLQIMIKKNNVKKYYFYNSSQKFIPIREPYELESKDVFIGRVWKKDVKAYSKDTEELIWEKDVSSPEYGIFKDIDGEVYPNSLNSAAMADDDTIYLSMKGGQLIALNSKDGSTKWMLDGEKGKCVLYKNFIYKNTGVGLVVIDINTHKAINEVSYSSYKNNEAGMTGDFNVYEDVIVMKNQMDENVVVIDRKTLKMLDYIHLENCIRNSSSYCTVWHNNRLHAIDGNFVMHIYELE